jgi:pimeloyl-ACP methyl ester carboxylesterase
MPHAVREGVHLHYQTVGDGPPLVMIMGLGGDATWWERQVGPFAMRHKVILVENRGVGASDKPPGPYTTQMMAADTLAVMDDAGAPRAHVLGISMGGMIAQELALAAQERVASLTLAATYAKPDQAIRKSAGASPVPENFGGADAKQMFKMLMAMVLTPEFIKREKEWLKANFQRTLENGTTMDHFKAHVHAVMHHDTTDRLASLRVPTLVVTGDQDLLVPPHHSDLLASLIPDARLVKIPGGTHGFNVEMPDAFNDVVLSFLSTHAI